LHQQHQYYQKALLRQQHQYYQKVLLDPEYPDYLVFLEGPLARLAL
jgi:hypothetical protein